MMTRRRRVDAAATAVRLAFVVTTVAGAAASCPPPPSSSVATPKSIAAPEWRRAAASRQMSGLTVWLDDKMAYAARAGSVAAAAASRGDLQHTQPIQATYEDGRRLARQAVSRRGAGTQPLTDAGQGVLVVFVRAGCPHCADAKAFLASYLKEHPELRVVFRPVDEDPNAAAELISVFEQVGMWPPGVPTFVMNGQVIVGFDDAEHSGAALRELIEAGLPRRDQVETSLFGTLSASRMGLPLFTIALGLLDGFNPCAMWVLLFLLSLLVHLQNRARMALIAGVFVLVSGAVYYAFMAAWLNVFLIVGLSAALRWILGGVAIAIGGLNIKDYFAWGRGFSLSIPPAAKPGLYARARSVLGADSLATSLVAVAVLAAIVNVVELLCTAGLPAIYTAVLTQQELAPLVHYGYLGLYIVGYMADDAVMVATAVMALGSRKLTERGGRWLKLISGVTMLLLGLVLVARPDWLL